jgi:lipopolysaccharide/colanic/teichoic acid biosynthesis glycosyltransferase
MKRFFVYFFIDIGIAVFVFLFALLFNGSLNAEGFGRYGGYGLFYYSLHLFISLAHNKYDTRAFRTRDLPARCCKSWIYSTGTILLLIYTLQLGSLSRQVVLMNIFGLLLFEALFIAIVSALRASDNAGERRKLDTSEVDLYKAFVNRRNTLPGETESVLDLADELSNELGDDKARLVYISGIVDKEPGKALLLKTSNVVNIYNQPTDSWQKIINLQRLNVVRYVNKFLEAVNSRLPVNGLAVVCAETKDQRKERLLNKFPPMLNYIYYTLDYGFKRVLPKVPVGKKIYFTLTRGRNRVMSRSEILGRLFSCGFEVIAEHNVNGLLVVAARKKGEPSFNMEPTYGPFIHLKRVGKDGKTIKVYKFRTMHPYSEYLQEYVYRSNSLSAGGKIKDDYRVNSIGRLMRKYWIDELPMLINFFKGEMKIVGVRPISQHYFSLYSPEMQQLRVRTKPGLVPPFYADMPKTLTEIQDSERRYLEAWLRAPFRTDVKYFFLAFWNIVFKHARSN